MIQWTTLQLYFTWKTLDTVQMKKFGLFLFCYIISCRTIIWRNSPGTRKLFYIKRNIIRIMAGSKRRVSCREIFRKSDVLTLASGFLCWVDICWQHRKISDNLRYTQYNLHMLSTGFISTEEDFTIWCQLTGHCSTKHETSELQHRRIPASISAIFHFTHELAWHNIK